MKEKETVFTVNGKEYKAIFNLNVMQAIQIEYGTFTKWGELTDGYAYDENGERILKLDEKGEPVTKTVKNENNEDIEVAKCIKSIGQDLIDRADDISKDLDNFSPIHIDMAITTLKDKK